MRRILSLFTRKHRSGLLTVTVVIGLSFQHAMAQPEGGMPPSEVAAITVSRVTVPASFEYVGQTAGSREIEVRARVNGILQKRHFAEGSRVAQGQPLFSLDSAMFEVAVAAAEAMREGAEARVAQAQRNLARVKPMFLANVASQKDFDDAVSNESIAAADLKAVLAKLNEAKLNLSYSHVLAPLRGTVGRALKQEGAYISGPDVLLTTVIQSDPMYVLFGVSDEERLKIAREVDAGRLVLPRNGQFIATVKLADGRIYEKTGKLSFSDVRVSGGTSTSETRAELPNPTGVLRPGQFVRVALTGAKRPNIIQVPQRAVLQGPQGRFVYVVNAQNQAESRTVVVGEWLGDNWLVESGLNVGDKVIVDGVMKIGPGAPVRIAENNASKR